MKSLPTVEGDSGVDNYTVGICNQIYLINQSYGDKYAQDQSDPQTQR
jgi:hypothetical protein